MDEQLQMLDEANREIKILRQHNFIMQQRLDVFDSMISVFNARPSSSDTGMAPDITYAIDKLLESKKSVSAL